MKKSKLYVITLIIFLIGGITLFLVGGVMAGWDIVGWFSSQTAMWAYVLLILYIIFVVLYECVDRIRKL